MALNGIVAKYHLEDWYRKTFTTPLQKDFINTFFPNLCNGIYEKGYSVALALATNIIPALDLPTTNFGTDRKMNARIQEKFISKTLKLIDENTPIIEQHIIYNIIIYYIMRHQGIFIDSERAIEFSERQMNIFPEISKIIDEYKSSYSEFDLEKNYGYETLYKIYEQRDDKDKILELLQKKQSKKDSNHLDEEILNDDALINSYCEKTYKEVFENNPTLFLHNALSTLEYPKSMKPWIEFLSICDKSNPSDFSDIENPIETLKPYKNYVGIILNSTEQITDYIEKAHQLFPTNKTTTNPKNPREIIISIENSDVTFKENPEKPWCHYYAELARYLNRNGFKINLQTIIANYMKENFDFLTLTGTFQKNFDELLQFIDKNYFRQIPLKQSAEPSFKPILFTEDAIKNYLRENARRIITESWHSILWWVDKSERFDNFLDNLASEFEEFYLIKLISKKADFQNEHRIKEIFTDTFENQEEYFSTISLKPTANIDAYLQLAKNIFPNHKIEYDTENLKLLISIEKEDFIIKEITDNIIEENLKSTNEIFLKIKKQNEKALYADEYIDLKSYAEYIFESNLVVDYKRDYFEKLKQFLQNLDKNDIAENETTDKDTESSKYELDYASYAKIDFSKNADFLRYADNLKNKFITNFKSIVSKHWEYLHPNIWEKDYENMIPYLFCPFEFYDEKSETITLLYGIYDIENIEENVFGNANTNFLPKIDWSEERYDLQKQKQIFTFGVNLSYVSLESIKENLSKIFPNRFTKINVKKRIAVVEIGVTFSDFELFIDKKALELSFKKNLGFLKLAYCTNLQSKSEEQFEYISDNALLFAITYNESRYLMKVKNSFFDKLEQFFYAIGRENFVEKYDSEDLFSKRNF